MNNKALKTLEYNKIIEQLTAMADSEPGKLMCSKLMPSADVTEIHHNQELTANAVSHIFRSGNISFKGLKDIRPQLQSIKIGSTLNSKELLDISMLLNIASSVLKYSQKDSEPEHTDSLSAYFNLVDSLPSVNNEIKRCIIAEDEISDDASPELKNIRRQLRQMGDRIKNELSSILNGSKRTYLQEAVITSRNGRYCIPVKSEYKSQIPGMVHDQSKAGSTFFIEPMSVVKLNNEIRELELKEIEEISKILASLTVMAGNYTTELLSDYDVLSCLDFIFAKAKLAVNMKASQPVMNQDGHINIKKARHPLIDSKKVVPVNIYMEKDCNQLIITGPNTGGKTVTLKTIGLFSLMAQAGLHIPAFDNSELTVFKNIFADIGDEQSIEQNLSTFSSHIKNIVSILEQADESCLVLFDELCAGTDPTEGAALAMSILSYLNHYGIITVATTHYSELKIYALSTRGVENACCEFDVATLAPTYRLLIGVPGKSNAFAISHKLGLPSHIIDSAKANIGTSQKAFEDVISDLEQSRTTIEKEQLEIESYKQEILQLKEKLRKQQENLSQKADTILENAREEAADILRQAKETANETIRTFNKASSKGMSVAELEKERRRINEHMDKINSKRKITVSAPKKLHDPKDFHIGDKVHIMSLGMDGTIHTLPNPKGELTVTCGILHSTVKISDVEIIQEVSEAKKLQNKGNSIGKLKMSKTVSISPEINLIGMTADEAIITLDKYMDDAFLSHISPVRVVHGKGSGVLRNAVHNYLKRQKHVKSYRLGTFGEGDYGVTIVEFKE